MALLGVVKLAFVFARSFTGAETQDVGPKTRYARANSYALAIGLMLTAFLLTSYFQTIELRRPSLFLFFAAVVLTTWLCGTALGLLSAAVSVAAGLYFYALSGHFVLSADQLLMCGFFGCSILAGNFLNAHQRNADHALRQAHEKLQRQAKELQHVNAALRTEIVERTKTQSALDDSQTELTRVARLTTMGELAASIAHEVNQPLTAITTNASTLLRWLSTDPPSINEARHSAQSIKRDGERAGEIIRNTRSLVRKSLPERELVDINRVVTDVLALLRHEVTKRHITVHFDRTDTLPMIYGDRVQLQQVLLNILMNAAEALDDVSDADKFIRICTGYSGDLVTIAVEDTGPGFSGSATDSFETFYTTKKNGMGMGLSICRSIVERHGGTMTATSLATRGAHIFLSLPLDGEWS